MERTKLGKVLFFAESTNNPGTYMKIGESKIMSGREALEVYANTPNPPSQLCFGDTEAEVEEKVKSVIKNMADKDWVEEFLEPYL